MKLSSSPMNILSNNAIQSTNQFISSSSCDQTLNLFDKQRRCTCHYFNFNGNNLAKNGHKKVISIEPISYSPLSSRPSINKLPSLEYSSDIKYILTVADFCFWYDIRSTLFDIIDRIVAMNETHHLIVQKIPSTVIKLCLPQSNTIYRKIRRAKTSIAIQTSYDYEQRRNVKVQTNTVTLFPLQKQNLSSSKLFLN